MSTRKLILSAIACALVIILAGGAKIFQMSRDTITVEVFTLGTERTLADMTVTVDSISQNADATIARVTMVGVEGADATEGWWLFAGGTLLSPIALPVGTLGVPCATTKLAVTTSCDMAFPAAEGSVTVAYVRAETTAQWAGQ
ncbi:MAG: hypothetical protein RI898_1111 [Actinomycetota bacterium]|jgi:hypothetical protein